jgi:hypothetical protein
MERKVDTQEAFINVVNRRQMLIEMSNALQYVPIPGFNTRDEAVVADRCAALITQSPT